MRANLRIIRKHCCYSEGFKKQLVAEFENGKYSIPQLGQLRSIDCRLIYD